MLEFLFVWLQIVCFWVWLFLASVSFTVSDNLK